MKDRKLTQSNNVKFLGMVFDRSLTSNAHIDYLIDRCRKRINILKLLTGSKWGADKQTMVTLYKTLIRPILDYGCGIYNSASPSIKSKLDVIQSQALRLCCGALSCTPISALEVDCGIPPLQLRRKFLSGKLALRYIYMSNSPTHECFEDCPFLHYGKYTESFKRSIGHELNRIESNRFSLFSTNKPKFIKFHIKIENMSSIPISYFEYHIISLNEEVLEPIKLGFKENDKF